MQENAEKYDKVTRFEKAINYVIRLQRTYRAVIFRRVVRRALMAEEWDKFFEDQKLLSMKAELNFKKQQ